MKNKKNKIDKNENRENNDRSFSDKFIDIMVDYKLIMIAVILIIVLISKCS